jgi:hypothetical protein
MADDRVILKNYKGDVYEYPEISQTQVAGFKG